MMIMMENGSRLSVVLYPLPPGRQTQRTTLNRGSPSPRPRSTTRGSTFRWWQPRVRQALGVSMSPSLVFTFELKKLCGFVDPPPPIYHYFPCSITVISLKRSWDGERPMRSVLLIQSSFKTSLQLMGFKHCQKDGCCIQHIKLAPWVPPPEGHPLLLTAKKWSHKAQRGGNQISFFGFIDSSWSLRVWRIEAGASLTWSCRFCVVTRPHFSLGRNLCRWCGACGCAIPCCKTAGGLLAANEITAFSGAGCGCILCHRAVNEEWMVVSDCKCFLLFIPVCSYESQLACLISYISYPLFELKPSTKRWWSSSSLEWLAIIFLALVIWRLGSAAHPLQATGTSWHSQLFTWLLIFSYFWLLTFLSVQALAVQLDDGWPESVEEQGLLLLVWRRKIRNDVWKMCYRQSRWGVSRRK